MRPTRRQILEEHGLTLAPPDVRALFWRSYNARRRKVTRMGDLAATLVAQQAATISGPMRELADAWAAILPEDVAASSRVETLRAGCLNVSVDSSATRFALSRHMGDTLIEALNAAIGKKLVRKIDFRIARLNRREIARRPAAESQE